MTEKPIQTNREAMKMVKKHWFYYVNVAAIVIVSLLGMEVVVKLALIAMSPDMIWGGTVLFGFTLCCAFVILVFTYTLGVLIVIHLDVQEW